MTRRLSGETVVCSAIAGGAAVAVSTLMVPSISVRSPKRGAVLPQVDRKQNRGLRAAGARCRRLADRTRSPILMWVDARNHGGRMVGTVTLGPRLALTVH